MQDLSRAGWNSQPSHRQDDELHEDLKSAEVQALSDDNIKKIISGGKGKIRP